MCRFESCPGHLIKRPVSKLKTRPFFVGAGRRRGQRRRRRGEGVGSLFRYNFRCHPGCCVIILALLSALYTGCCVVIRTLLSALYTYFIRTLPALSGKVNQIAANSRHFPLRPIHYRCPTQGNYLKTTGKVNRIPANPRHFPLSPIHYRCSTQGNYLKTTGKVNHIPTKPWHFPPDREDRCRCWNIRPPAAYGG